MSMFTKLRVVQNLSAFLLGISITWLAIFFVSQSGGLTANVSDAFSSKDNSGINYDMQLSFWSWVLTWALTRTLSFKEWESLRLELLASEEYFSDSWSLQSSYNHSFVVQSGIITIIIVPWKTQISDWDELFSLITNIKDNYDQPIVQSFDRYGEDKTDQLNAVYLNTIVHY